jgi:flagellar biosynthesis protein FlhF
MRLKRIIAADRKEATALADAAYGSGFVLADGETQSGAYLALVDETDAAYGFPAPDWLDEPERLIAEVLALHQVPAPLAERILTAIEEAENRPIGNPVADLAGGLAACLSFAAFAGLWRSGGSVALIGPPGAGKTTLAAKLAARARRGRPILLNADTTRAGTLAQLSEYAEILGARLEQVGEVEALAHSLRGRAHRIIIDTPGINPSDDGAIAQLERLIGAARAEPILVLPADLGAVEAAAMAASFRRLPIRRFVATRLDMVRRLGGILAAAEAGGYDIVGASVTPHFAYGLRPLTPTVLARRLLSAALDDRRWHAV